MTHQQHTVPTPDLTRAAWRKSSRSSTGSQCVEVAAVDGVVAVRDSKNPTGPALCFTPAAWATFVTATRTDQLTE